MGDKELMWNLLKDDIGNAVREGYRRGYNSDYDTREGGQFQSYQYVLDKMKQLEGGSIDE